MSVTYRPANEADLEPAMGITADAVNDLRARHVRLQRDIARAGEQREIAERDVNRGPGTI